ncbi:hypothetical protein PVL29_012055 [Vitis rotundifolia]|uniref:Uncharacterized protein n=1 Tax=Vitis rotundifolia TaxID=103349 RepID=A0AA38ZQ00_VITRO|nr:hypothetical protein PVL29_012055 [Vitis rotundifolia]
MVNFVTLVLVAALGVTTRNARGSGRDRVLGKMIGHAKEKNGLYYLDTSSGNVGNGNQLPLSFLFESSSSNKGQIGFITFDLATLHLMYLRSCSLCFLRILM